LPVTSRWRWPAARLHYSPEHHDAGLPQSQKLLGIRPRQPARRLERLGDIRDLAGGTDAEHRVETNAHEIADSTRPISRPMENKGKNNFRKPFNFIAAASALLTLSMAANAAEVPPYPRPVAPPVYLPPPLSWTGFYIGANLGGAWSQRNLTDTLLGLSLRDVNDKGAFIGGGQLVFNYQFGNFVLGVEGDFDGVATTNSPGTGVVGPAFGTIQVTSNNRWITTLAGRFGVANDTWLFYGKAGGGW